MHRSRNTCGCQSFLHLFSVVYPDGVLRPSAGVVGIDVWRGVDARLIQQVGVALGHLITHCHFVIQHRQLGQQYSGLQGVKPAVHAHANVVVPLVLPVAGNLAHHFRQFVIVSKNGTTITITAQRLAGEETGAGYG